MALGFKDIAREAKLWFPESSAMELGSGDAPYFETIPAMARRLSRDIGLTIYTTATYDGSGIVLSDYKEKDSRFLFVEYPLDIEQPAYHRMSYRRLETVDDVTTLHLWAIENNASVGICYTAPYATNDDDESTTIPDSLLDLASLLLASLMFQRLAGKLIEMVNQEAGSVVVEGAARLQRTQEQAKHLKEEYKDMKRGVSAPIVVGTTILPRLEFEEFRLRYASRPG